MATDVKIDTTNPNAITNCTSELALTILGGIRLDGLDRLRVTIRIEVVNRKFDHYMNTSGARVPQDLLCLFKLAGLRPR